MITIKSLSELISEQCSQWSHLSIKPVEFSGVDNQVFRLGDQMLIRLPSAETYAGQVTKEQKWLPLISPQLSIKIPEPLFMGDPSEHFPWKWSIYSWIEGESANVVIDGLDMKLIAMQLSNFLNELHKIDISQGPVAGKHNYHRGGHVSVYDDQARLSIEALRDLIDVEKAIMLWKKAMESSWKRNPVWVHGDLASGNILVKDKILTAVIDFGCMGIGDPACDLMIAWTFFSKESRRCFKSNLSLDSQTWDRARGWALWKAGFEILQSGDRNCVESLKWQKVVSDILSEIE